MSEKELPQKRYVRLEDTYDNINTLKTRAGHVADLLASAAILKGHGAHQQALRAAGDVCERFAADLRNMNAGLRIRSRNVRVVVGKWEVHCPTNDSSCIVYDGNEARLLPFYVFDLDDLRKAITVAQSQLQGHGIPTVRNADGNTRKGKPNGHQENHKEKEA